MKPTDRWRPTPAHARASLGGLVLAVTAVLARRPDLLVLATPLAVVASFAVITRPRHPPRILQSIGHSVLREGEATTWKVSIEDPDGRVDDVAVVLATPEFVDMWPVDGQAAAGMRDDGSDPLTVAVRPIRWGTRRIGPALVVASSCWGGFRWVSKSGSDARRLVTLPISSRFDASAPPVRVPGLVGTNRSPRQGSGTEFASIRPFQPGDRLRRIHWAHSARTGTLHVTSTWADHDRHVVVLVDAFDDVGGSGGIEGGASSLDIGVRAASAIAAHYIAAGDRVALAIIGVHGVKRLPPATGNRHLRRVLEALANIEPVNTLTDDGRAPRNLGGGALIVMLSPLVSAAALQRAVSLVERGSSVLVVDCLPEDVAREEPGDPYVSIAWRIKLLERDREIRRARSLGIPIVPWRGPGSLDVVLRDLHHHARAGFARR